jgi:hypothetical protein
MIVFEMENPVQGRRSVVHEPALRIVCVFHEDEWNR